MKKFKRKPNRIDSFDYGTENLYFVTICSKDKQCIFGYIKDEKMFLSKLGMLVKRILLSNAKIYDNVNIDSYVIMPNHLHFILEITSNNGNSLSTIINQYKGAVSKACGFPIWQKSFYDHVIRNEWDYYRVLEYIEENILKWDLDEYFKS